MIKSKSLSSTGGQLIHILHEGTYKDLGEVMRENRNISDESFFSPSLSDLHDPFLMPDMEKAVDRILIAREKKERIVIFGDYDVDGVSSTAILVRFLSEIGCEVSYRLPHRVHDGYGLKRYFFDELRDKWVTLVITVDCGTRDIEPIRHAKSLGIDVIVTDHHAVPDIIPKEVVAIVNPKRKDSKYPFQNLAGAGVAFKLVHAIVIALNKDKQWNGGSGGETVSREMTSEKWWAKQGEASFLPTEGFGTFSSKSTDNRLWEIYKTLTRYIDFASLGTVADCMPITWENRTITALGLRQMQNSDSAGLRKFLEGRDDIEWNADIIGFQIGPRINAAGRMDTPLTALRWLLASEDRCDEFLSEMESWNETRKWTTEAQYERALAWVDTTKPILFFDADDLDHGIIGLVAGRLTELYGKPAIVMKNWHDHPLTRRKWDEVEISLLDPLEINTSENNDWKKLSIGSCRAPEWCNLIEILDECRHFFVRYGWHRQAAGFTIETEQIPEFREAMWAAIATRHDIANLPKRTIEVECALAPSGMTLETLAIIDRFRPFGIGNRKPIFLLEDITITECRYLGKDESHLSLRCSEAPDVKMVYWKSREKKNLLEVGNIVSLVVELSENEWQGKKSIQAVVRDLISCE
jgi:single-stranded-DNA-specific exonuclease